MTICIAAIGKNAKDEEFIVFATDHMVTIGDLGQFEKSIAKYKVLNTNTVALLSGNPLIFDDLIKDCAGHCEFEKTRELIHTKMCAIKDAMLNKEVFEIFKIDFNYIKELLKAPIPNIFVQNLLDTINNFRLNTFILLIGYKNNLAQITEISEIGLLDYRDIDFGAVGSGTVQAINTLYFQRQSKTDPLPITLYNVYKAKRNAEVSVGVGKETDVIVLTQKGTTPITSEQLKKLSEIYESELSFGKNHNNLNEIVSTLKDM